MQGSQYHNKHYKRKWRTK